jgi:hypothetical protein
VSQNLFSDPEISVYDTLPKTVSVSAIHLGTKQQKYRLGIEKTRNPITHDRQQNGGGKIRRV